MIIGPRLDIDFVANSLHPRLPSQINLTNEISPWSPFAPDSSIDEMSIPRSGELAFRRELRQHVIDCQPVRRGGITNHRTMAAPNVILGPRDDPGPHRIQDYVAQHLEVVGLLLDQKGLVTTLKEMTDTLMTPIERLRISAVEPLHAS